MKYLLDTNAVIAILKGHEAFLARLMPYRPADFGLPSIVAFELFYGAHRSKRRDENLRRIAAIRFEVLDFNQEDASHAGRLRAELATLGTPIGPYDILIAGQAWSRGLTLITHNVREFQRIPHITLEDWEI